MLRCALMAPSGKRLNPWEFVVITDTATIRAMAPCKEYGAGMLETAMAAIVVAVDEQKSTTALFDGAIAAEHLLLAAEEQGLGACNISRKGRDFRIRRQHIRIARNGNDTEHAKQRPDRYTANKTNCRKRNRRKTC